MEESLRVSSPQKALLFFGGFLVKPVMTREELLIR